MATYHYTKNKEKRVDFLIRLHDKFGVKRANASQNANWAKMKKFRLLEVRVLRLLYKACISIEGMEKPE